METKKLYGENCPNKRQSQALLMANLPEPILGQEITGLAGDEPSEYMQLLFKYFRYKAVHLYSLSSDHPLVHRDNILKAPVTRIMDLDWEGTIINYGMTTKLIFDEMYKLRGKKVLMLTFSYRNGLEETIEWLNKNIFDNTLSVNGVLLKGGVGRKGYIHIMDVFQSKFKHCGINTYTDSGMTMLSLIISW